MKLLIVDDSNIMRRAIEKYLSEFSLEIIGKAGDGKTALEIFNSEKPDIVTLDITMPEMDGLACLEEIMKVAPATKVMIITALSDKKTGLEALKKGAAAFLPKPFSEEQLKQEMKILIGELQ